MKMRHVYVVGMMLAMMWATSAGAGLNLWISYHYAGLDSYEYGQYVDAGKLLSEAKAEVQPCEGGYRLASTLDRMGMVCVAQQKYGDAEELYKCALCMKEDSTGPKSRPVPATLNNLADLYYVAGKDREEVEHLYRRALDLNRRDQLNIEVCRSLNGLALLHNDAGEFTQAEKLLRRAIEIHEKSGRREDPYLATNLTNLGVLLTNLGRFCEAEPVFDRAQYIQDKALGEEHPDVAVRLAAYANLLAKTDRQAEGYACQQRSDAIREKFAKLNSCP